MKGKEITLPFEYIPLAQSFIRNFLEGNKQYENTMIMTITGPNNFSIERHNDELISFLQNPEWPKSTSPADKFKVNLSNTYNYNFFWNNDNVDVRITINKVEQEILRDNITEFNWENINESATIWCSNEQFLYELQVCWFLHTPRIDHYKMKDGLVANTITLVAQDTETPADKYYNAYIASKNIKPGEIINPNVHQVHNKSLDMVSKNIKSFVANVKTDGIRTFVVIYNNDVLCYQRDCKFYYKHNKTIKVNAIFDCELCEGQLHIFDCYGYDNKDLSGLIFTDRIEYIHKFCEDYPEFIPIKIVNGADCLETYNTFADELFEMKDILIGKSFENTIKNLLNMNPAQSDLDFKDNYISKLESIMTKMNKMNNATYQDVLMYLESLIQIMKKVDENKYKDSLELCKRLNIDKQTIFAYSAPIIHGLIYLYNKLGYTELEKEFKIYSCNFVQNCRNRNANIPLSFNEIVTKLYNDYNYSKDGIIFTRNAPMEFGNVGDDKTMYFKWKPKDLLSADVKLVFNINEANERFDSDVKYVNARVMISKKNHEILWNNTDLELNNFNKRQPMCENGDIVLSGNIVEVVPEITGNDIKYKLLRIRHDKKDTNAKTTIENIMKVHMNYENILLNC